MIVGIFLCTSLTKAVVFKNILYISIIKKIITIIDRAIQNIYGLVNFLYTPDISILLLLK